MNDMGSTIPAWLTTVSWIFLGLALVSAGILLYDIYGRGYRQRLRAMEVVWVTSALYLGPLAVLAYSRWGRPRSEKWQDEHGDAPEKSLPVAAATGGLTGGAASALAHVVGVPLVVLSGLTIAGLDLWAMILVIAVMATALLFAFEYFFSTARERELPPARGLGVALLIALVTVLAFDVGMGGWMLFLHFSAFMPAPTDIAFLFLMQIGLILGFLTGYPAVAWLVGRGTKATV
ncbi:MAG: DUF4396 domain-containing protein [Actinomycetota bacterium]|jgi:hypothetical protein|nr:DUF4396 domain-containing protein [Thermoleophilaceae bacterium]MDQ3240691.1 DUF4396 domain-containing protein [Actinomycetota bacterium]